MTLSKLLQEKFDLNYYDLYLFSIDASKKYKTYKIPKRNGNKRTIHHPSKELKKYQRIFSKLIFAKLPVHKCVYSYKRGISIKDLALRHKDERFLLRVDFKDFFPSLKSKSIRHLLEKNLNVYDFKLTSDDMTIINSIVCRYGSLTIGAPTSPIISNAILYDLDSKFNSFSKDITYSRYADDLYFSTNKPNILKNVIPFIKQVLADYFINLQINEDKNIYTSKKRKRMITGLVLTSDNKVSIGKEKKNQIKTLVYQYKKGDISQKNLEYLKGYMSFIQSVEDTFITSLISKYNKETIDSLLN